MSSNVTHQIFSIEARAQPGHFDKTNHQQPITRLDPYQDFWCVYPVNPCHKTELSRDTSLTPSLREVSARPLREHDVITLSCRRATVKNAALAGGFAGDGELVPFGWKGGRKEAAVLWLGVICCNIGIVHHCQRDKRIRNV